MLAGGDWHRQVHDEQHRQVDDEQHRQVDDEVHGQAGRQQQGWHKPHMTKDCQGTS